MGAGLSLLCIHEPSSSTERAGGLSPVSLQSLCQQSLTAALINFAQRNDLNLLAVYMARVHTSVH